MNTEVSILIVDNDPAVRRTISDALTTRGYKPTAVATGKAALDKIEKDVPVVALIDLMLEDMSGLEVMGKLKGRCPGTECILLTGHTSQDSAIEAVNLGAYSYLQKPYEMRQLLMTTRRAVEKWEAEESLRESEEHRRNLFDSLPVGLYRTTPEGQIVNVNPALVQLLGYPDRESLLAINVSDGYVDSEDRRRWQTLIEREGVVRNFEVQWRRGDGTAIWVKEDSRIVRDDEGRVLYYDGAVEDITERKQAEEALRESEAKYRSLTDDVLDSSAVGIFILDSDFRIVWVNQALERYFGLRRDEIIGQDKRQLIHERIKDIFEDPESFVERVLATYDDNTYIEDFECHVLPDGARKERWLEHWSQPIRSGLYAGGRIEHYYDITKRKRAEQALSERLRELACLYAVSQDMQEDWSTDELYRQIVEHLVPAMRFPEIAVPVIELDGRRFTSERYTEGLSHGLQAEIRVGSEARGHLWAYYAEDRPFLIPEEQNLLDAVAETIGLWMERERAEEALQASKEYYNSIIESIPSSLLTIDHNLRVVSANRNFLQKARRSESETIGRRINEVFSPAVLAYSKLEERITEVFKTGNPFKGGEMERLPGLFGRVYFYRISPLKDERGEVKNTVLLMDDVTEQKRLSEEVRRAERHLASVVDSANDLVVSMNPEGRILTWNKAAGQTSGFKFGEVKSQYLPHLCVEEDQQGMGAWLAQLAKGQFTKKSMEINLKTKGGREVPISWVCSRMLDDEHRIVGLVAVGRDLTERKRLEAQLIKSAKLTSLGVMAGGIAHEIRNPLAIGSAAAQLLLEGSDDEKLRKEAAEKIYSGIQRASYIIENLLKFARPPEERMAAVDTGEALEETLSLLANQLKVQQIELRKDFASELPLVVGNKSLLQGVFSNLILNACNAMPEGGNLTVTTRVNSDNQVEMEFADTGCGIPKENLSKIFDPFFTTMPVGKGTGLGLSISYSIIKQHHGKIDVESKVGGGSTFTVRLPGAMDEKRDTSG